MGIPVSAFIRLIRAGYVLAREGVPRLVDEEMVPPSGRVLLRLARLLEKPRGEDSNAARLSDALNRLGPSYIKLGQFLATRRDVVGEVVARDLETLQDRLPPFGMSEARTRVETALGGPVETLYSSFSEPLAAASIAQVHRASIATEDGPQDVAVKVLRPGVHHRFGRDLKSFYLAARLFERLSPASRRLRPVAVVDTLARSVNLEMDLRLEAAALSEMAENTANDPGFRVPGVVWERTARNVLTLEWIDGTKLTDIAAIAADGHDLVDLGRTLIQSFLRHAVRDGFFHADMHPGNLFLDRDGKIVAVDFGIMGRLGPKERRYLAEILYGFIKRDYFRVAAVHFEAGYVPDYQDVAVFAQAIRAIGEPLQGRTAKDVSMARLLTQLFEVTELFDMHTQPQLLLLQKTMVVVEGVARTLDPDLNMWTTAEPVVREWIEGHFGPGGRLQEAAEGVSAVGRLVTEVPDLIARAERLSSGFAEMAREGLRLDLETVRAIAREEARRGRGTRLAIWIGAISLAVIAIMSLSV
ncbi:MAG: 2-polyprenylphenol 6-hydroxylase [Hyphomicrobiales bacterium]